VLLRTVNQLEVLRAHRPGPDHPGGAGHVEAGVGAGTRGREGLQGQHVVHL
jgi:hypothetical protein